jgi:hypothetical protein
VDKSQLVAHGHIIYIKVVSVEKSNKNSACHTHRFFKIFLFHTFQFLVLKKELACTPTNVRGYNTACGEKFNHVFYKIGNSVEIYCSVLSRILRFSVSMENG